MPTAEDFEFEDDDFREPELYELLKLTWEFKTRLGIPWPRARSSMSHRHARFR